MYHHAYNKNIFMEQTKMFRSTAMTVSKIFIHLIIPSCRLHVVCDLCNPMIHTLTVQAGGNVDCNLQSVRVITPVMGN